MEHHWVKDNFEDVSLQKLLLNTITSKIEQLDINPKHDYHVL